MRRWLPITLGLLISAWAPSGLAAKVDAATLVHDTAEKVLQRLRTEREVFDKDPGKVYDLVEEIVLPHFDFAAMSRLVLGVNWRRATPEQRVAFTAQFRNLLVRTYAKVLVNYRDQTILYLPFHPGEGARLVVVKTEIKPPAGPNIPVFYRLLSEKDGWKVVDILVDGVSLVTNYRSSFNTEIGQKGLDELIANLKKLNTEKREYGK